MFPRLLADENIARPVVRGLRALGYDVSSVIEHSARAADRQVLALASAESRWLLSHDRDYGELIFKDGCAAPPGVIYLRFTSRDPAEVVSRIVETLGSFAATSAFLTVGRRGSVRVRPFPAASPSVDQSGDVPA